MEGPLEGQDVVSEFRGEVEVSDEINEARETLTDDVREVEGIFLPEDPEVEVIGAENDLIDSVEEGQLNDAELKLLFSDESAEQVANMFENIEGEEIDETTETSTTNEESIFDDGEVDGEAVSDDSFDGMGDPEDDAFSSDAEADLSDESATTDEIEPAMDATSEDEVIFEGENVTTYTYDYPADVPVAVQTGVSPTPQTASVAPEKAQEFFKKPIVQALAVASVVGIVAFFIVKDSK